MNKKPKLLDLFCKAGGASMGLYNAGFDVEGVDKDPQPHYPFKFYQADALEFPLEGYDGYWASPPCQKYSEIRKALWPDRIHPDLIAPTRERLLATGKHYIIENIAGAKRELIKPIRLCGSMFGLHSGEFYLRRHRYFECTFDILLLPGPCSHIGLPLSVYGHPGGSSCRDHQKFGQLSDWCIGMGIDWMTTEELAQAIPPVYSYVLGRD